MCEKYLPRPTILHPYPSERFRARLKAGAVGVKRSSTDLCRWRLATTVPTAILENLPRPLPTEEPLLFDPTRAGFSLGGLWMVRRAAVKKIPKLLFEGISELFRIGVVGSLF
jgi:hypothetical protein